MLMWSPARWSQSCTPRGRSGLAGGVPVDDVDRATAAPHPKRTTPARAGRISGGGGRWSGSGDDPRAGGADLEQAARTDVGVGRPPRGRGGYFVTWGVVT
ncbi:hypothetical protein SSCG_03246 [Streptomyces clavuligerus]|nr:hypothetical protein SSCG_03246 [Streptomyces clavuligerus]